MCIHISKVCSLWTELWQERMPSHLALSVPHFSLLPPRVLPVLPLFSFWIRAPSVVLKGFGVSGELSMRLQNQPSSWAFMPMGFAPSSEATRWEMSFLTHVFALPPGTRCEGHLPQITPTAQLQAQCSYGSQAYWHSNMDRVAILKRMHLLSRCFLYPGL